MLHQKLSQACREGGQIQVPANIAGSLSRLAAFRLLSAGSYKKCEWSAGAGCVGAGVVHRTKNH